MAIYEIEADRIKSLEPTSFKAVDLDERGDLQRLLKHQVEVVSPGTLIIAEEFGEWEESRRRIDLLGVDRDANLVVIELKRSEDGGHMELQAVRYAAMVSAMTFERAVEIYGDYLQSNGQEVDPQRALLEHIGWADPDEDAFAQDVRIVLASADFSKELTTSVLWLNDHGLDIRCVRLRPYSDGERTLLDVQQIIPLPEAQEYQVRLRDKQREERRSRRQGPDTTKFDVTVGAETYESLSKGRAIFRVVKGLCDAGVDPEEIKANIPWRRELFLELEGALDSATVITKCKEIAPLHGSTFRARRRFTADEELIHANGRTYVLTRKWGPRTEEAMTKLLDRWPDKGVRFSRSDETGNGDDAG